MFSTLTSQMLAFPLACFCCNSTFCFQTICKPVCGTDRMPFQPSCSRSWALIARPGHSCQQTPRTLCSSCSSRTLPRGLLPLKLLIIGVQLSVFYLSACLPANLSACRLSDCVDVGSAVPVCQAQFNFIHSGLDPVQILQNQAAFCSFAVYDEDSSCRKSTWFCNICNGYYKLLCIVRSKVCPACSSSS